MRRILLGALVAVLCGFVTLPLPIHWQPQDPQRVIALRIIPTGMPPGMVARILDAAALWTSPRVRFALTIDATGTPGRGTIALGPVAQGRAGTAHYLQGAWLGNCALLLSGEDGPWHTGLEPPPPAAFDTLTIVAHELGHCLGLDHSDGAEPPAVMRTLIHAGQWQRSLSPDDIAGRDMLFSPITRRSSGCALRM